MIRHLKLLGGLLFAATLAACGGGGGSPGATPNNPGGGGTKASPAAIEVFTSSPQLSSATNSSVSFTVVVKDDKNQAIPAQTVTFAASSGSLSGSLPAPSTGAAGEAITGVGLSPGTDRSNRDIVVTVAAGGVSKQVTIPVVGTTVSIAGDSSIVLNGQTTFTARAVDSGGGPIPGATLSLSSSLGNGLSQSSLVTNAQGAATFQYTASKAGVDTLTVVGLGASSETKISVSSDEFRFVSPTASSSVVVNTTQTVVVRFLSGGAPAANAPITFSTTRGTITPQSATTNASGEASAIISSTSSGPVNVVAQTGSAQATLPLNFIAVAPSSLVLQANPGAVAPNTGSSSINQAALLATVRDAAGNPVSGQVVNFTAVVDGSNGFISPGTSLTNTAGIAQAQFIAGPITTANNGVIVRATVQGTSISGTAALTVSGQALFISIATGNTITNFDPSNYEKEFSVYVTDVNGAAAAGRIINLSVFPEIYGKGGLAYLDPVWGYNANSPTFCPNEDANRNGFLDAGEDVNKDGRLTPGLPVVVSPASVTTDSTGFAKFKLQYGENFVPWLQVTITARATVGGTESVQSQYYVLEGVASDFSAEDVAPAGVISPFGVAQDCTVPN